ncbi:MAG: hypothetical protein ACKV2T_06450 [Kofleriaceae bacterium]
MSRWLIVLVLAVAPAVAWAQSSPTQVTQKAQDDVRQTERRVQALTASRNVLARQYDDQLKVVDRLKQQRASWRRDRALEEALAAARATATKLQTADGDLGRAVGMLAAHRRNLARAVDAELAATTVPARKTELSALKARYAPQAPKKNLQKIVIPDLEIDPLADPEELEQQAAELARAEQELERQAIGLDKQAKELDEVAKLRKQHDRAGDLARRDDDQPQRSAREGGVNRATGFGASEDAAPEAGGSPPPGTGGGGEGLGDIQTPMFESDATVVLSDVIDAKTIETLTNASRSRDPAQRAQAAKRARDAVNVRREQIRKKRAEIEAAAKARRRN